MRKERAVSKQWQSSASKRPHGWIAGHGQQIEGRKEGCKGQQKIIMLCKLPNQPDMEMVRVVIVVIDNV